MPTATLSMPKGAIKNNAPRTVGVVNTRTANTRLAAGNERAKLREEFDRNCEESHRYWSALGYTEETFMEMVNEEIRAYRREKAETCGMK